MGYEMRCRTRLAWAIAAAVVTIQSVAWGYPIESGDLGDAAEESENSQLLQQISGLQDGQASGPAPMPTMPATMPTMPTGGAPSNSERMNGIKEALTAVKPVMDKYVTTAKTLTGKYRTLKKEFVELKAAKSKNDPKQAAEFAQQLNQVKEEDSKKYNTLEGENKSLKKDMSDEEAKSEKRELGLAKENTKMVAINEGISHSFMTALSSAKKSATEELKNMRLELNRFLTKPTQESFDALGEATSKAIEAKQTMALEMPMVKSEIKQMLEKKLKEDKGKDDQKWGTMEEEDSKIKNEENQQQQNPKKTEPKEEGNTK